VHSFLCEPLILDVKELTDFVNYNFFLLSPLDVRKMRDKNSNQTRGLMKRLSRGNVIRLGLTLLGKIA
jgi:hypothetical protein